MNPYVPVLAAFLISRILSYFFLTVATEPQLFHQYATSVRDSSLAEVYRGTLYHQYSFLNEEHRQPPEYPQLTALFTVPPLWLSEAVPGLKSLVARRPRAAEYSPDEAAYEAALGLQIFVVDTVLLWLVYLAARRFYPEDSRLLRASRLGIYVAASAIFAPVWFDRLDMVTGAIAVGALLAFERGRSILAYSLLVIGAGFKLVPLLLLPVWVMATAARESPESVNRYLRRILREAVKAGGVLLAGTGLLYLFGGGDHAFVFLGGHALRGIQPETIYTLVIARADSPTLVFNHGGFHYASPLAARLVPFTTLITLLSLGLVYLVAARAFFRRSGCRDLCPALVRTALLVWLTLILTSKIGSPQFVIWLMPLVPLLPLKQPGEWRAVAWFLVLCSLLTLIYPLASGQLSGPRVALEPPAWAGPTTFGLALVAARAAILLGLSRWLAMSLLRRGDPDRFAA